MRGLVGCFVLTFVCIGTDAFFGDRYGNGMPHAILLLHYLLICFSIAGGALLIAALAKANNAKLPTKLLELVLKSVLAEIVKNHLPGASAAISVARQAGAHGSARQPGAGDVGHSDAD